MGWLEADMDFWWRGRADGMADATEEPAEARLLADISVRLGEKLGRPRQWERERDLWFTTSGADFFKGSSD